MHHWLDGAGHHRQATAARAVWPLQLAAAERRAEAARWSLMGAPVGVSLGLVLLFGLVWNQRERRRP